MDDFRLANSESVFLSKEWVMDPPPWIAVRLEESIIKEIYRIKAETMAKVAELEIQMKRAEQQMYQQIAKIVR